MEFPTKTIQLKNGANCLIRTLRQWDAADLQQHRIHVREETPLFFREGESTNVFDLEQQAAFLETCRAFPLCGIVGAFAEDKLIASADITIDSCITAASFSVSIRKEFWGQGLGSVLLEESIRLARQAGFGQVQLSVHKDNAPAIGLYRKFGFAALEERGEELKMQLELGAEPS